MAVEETNIDYTETDLDKIREDAFGNRSISYPSFEDQLDMIYNDMKAGHIDGINCDWYEYIKEIKDYWSFPDEV